MFGAVTGKPAGSSEFEKDPTPCTSQATSIDDAQLTDMIAQDEVPETDEQNLVDSDVEQSSDDEMQYDDDALATPS